jgi:hypothetical protein
VCAALEGVSHLVYVVDRAQTGRSVSMLELELQAGRDVDVVFMLHDITAAGARTWASLASAQRDKKMWEHLEPAVKAEIERVFQQHESVKHMPATEMAADVAKYGSVEVILRDALIPIKAKYNAAGELTKMKARFVVADRRQLQPH